MNGIINFLSSYIALAAESHGNVGEFAFGLTKEGLVVVSVALIGMLIAAFFAGRASKQTATAEERQTPDIKVAPTAEDNDDKQLVAVITAAIMAMRDEEAKANGTEAVGFKVVSFKRSEHR